MGVSLTTSPWNNRKFHSANDNDRGGTYVNICSMIVRQESCWCCCLNLSMLYSFLLFARHKAHLTMCGWPKSLVQHMWVLSQLRTVKKSVRSLSLHWSKEMSVCVFEYYEYLYSIPLTLTTLNSTKILYKSCLHLYMSQFTVHIQVFRNNVLQIFLNSWRVRWGEWWGPQENNICLRATWITWQRSWKSKQYGHLPVWLPSSIKTPKKISCLALRRNLIIVPLIG